MTVKLFELIFEVIQHSEEENSGLVKNLMNDLQNQFAVDLYLSYDKFANAINLSKIISTEKNKGVGTEVMKRICSFADSHSLEIILTPSSDFGGSIRRLEQFYKRFGFKKNKSFLHREKLAREPQR